LILAIAPSHRKYLIGFRSPQSPTFDQGVSKTAAELFDRGKVDAGCSGAGP
jgi:hypothetical protein